MSYNIFSLLRVILMIFYMNSTDKLVIRLTKVQIFIKTIPFNQ